MPEIDELEVMKSIDEQLSRVPDPSTKERILRWAWEKFVGTVHKSMPTGSGTGSGVTKGKSSKTLGPQKAKTSGLSIVRELNLKPSGKESLSEFVAKKKPSSTYEQCLVALYYLRNVLQMDPVTADHIYTCFKVMAWRVPADLRNTMQVAASAKGWLDTGNSSNLALTIHGENFVEHDLPTRKS